VQCSAESSKPAICSEKLQRLQGHVSVVSLPSRSCDGDVSNSFRCNAPVIAAISAALSPLCALVAGRAAVFPIPCGSAGGRRTCRMSCNLDLSAHRTPLPSSSSSSSSSRPRAVDHHAAVIIQSSVAWSSSSSSRRAVPPASVLSVERARPRRSSLATACITLSTAVLAARLYPAVCLCVCVCVCV